MAFENTTTEYDMDANSQQFAQEQRSNAGDFEPDLAVDGLSESLAVDGLSESILSRILGLFGVDRS
jgi:hypothetical protein